MYLVCGDHLKKHLTIYIPICHEVLPLLKGQLELVRVRGVGGRQGQFGVELTLVPCFRGLEATGQEAPADLLYRLLNMCLLRLLAVGADRKNWINQEGLSLVDTGIVLHIPNSSLLNTLLEQRGPGPAAPLALDTILWVEGPLRGVEEVVHAGCHRLLLVQHAFLMLQRDVLQIEGEVEENPVIIIIKFWF